MSRRKSLAYVPKPRDLEAEHRLAVEREFQLAVAFVMKQPDPVDYAVRQVLAASYPALKKRAIRVLDAVRIRCLPGGSD